MVIKRRLNCRFDFSSFPRAPRSIRRKVSSQRGDDVDCGISAMDLLASVAEKLLEESESSSTSTNAFEGGLKMKQEHVYNHKPCKSHFSHQANLASSSKSPSDNTSNVSLEQTLVSDCNRARGLKPLAGCGNKKEGCEFHVESGDVTEETGVVNVDAGLEEGSLIVDDTFSLKEPSQLPVQFPESVHLDGHVKLPTGTDGVSNGYRNRSKLDCRDDDEDYCKYYKFSDKSKSYRPLTRVGHGRVKYGRAVPRTDVCLKSLNRKRKLCDGSNPWKNETVHRKRRLSDKGLVVNSDGGVTSESVTPENGESENGVLSTVMGVPSEDSRVKFSIKSLRIPELLIEVPETATVGSLKRTVMEAVTALLDDELSIGVLVQGKKIRDDNNTLSQSGLSCRDNLVNLGFTLEPGPEKLGVPLCLKNPVMSKPTDSAKLSERSIASLAANCVENNQELLPYQMDISADEQQPLPDSRALVPVSALEPDALAIVPYNEQPKRTEQVPQRRTRRPFSVTEVEALVQAVEELGTGRWRDVKLSSFDNASHRTYVDLKDKWKTLVHTASLSPQQRRGEPVPQELLDRVLAAHRNWSQHPLKQNGKHQAAATMVIESGPSM